jgi:hypothetical protein
MKIAVASIATPDMEELTKITWPNKLEYCRKHGYYGLLQSQSWDYLGFDKIIFIDSLLDSNQYDWVLWLDNDTLFTNFNKKIEDVIDNNYDFIISTDYGTKPNAGVFLVKNSDNGKKYIKILKEKMYELKPVNKFLFGEEQTAIQATYQDHFFIKIIPQKYINAYPYSDIYGHPNGLNDSLGVNGNWEYGDFILHIPGFGPDLFHKRLEHFKKYKELVIK